MQLVHHGLGIRPVLLVKFPVALQRPVEKVNHDLIDLNALLLVPPRHLEHLVLGAVAQLTLPQPHQILREPVGAPGDSRVVFENLPGIFTGRDPVVHLPCRPGNPLIIIFAKGYSSHCRIVPQKSISHVRDRKGNGNLGIALGKLQHAALHVHTLLLVLSHAKNLFAPVALKLDVQRILGSPDDPSPLPVHHLEAAALPGNGPVICPEILPQNQPVIPVKGHYPSMVDHRLDAAVGNRRLFSLINGAVTHPVIHFLYDNLRLTSVHILCQSPVPSRKIRKHARPHTQGILPPGLNPHPLSLVKKH